jgi:D-alanine-D-alanine ligase
MVAAYAYGDVALVQRRITGTEVAISVVDAADGPRALPAVEIVPDSGVYDYAARYTAGTTRFFAPARLSEQVAAAAADASLAAYAALGLRDLARIDLMIDSGGRPVFLEANVAPGMTETSLFPQAALAAGEEIGSLLAGLLQTAVSRASLVG